MTLNPFLNFDGNCREAFEYYRSVFGGEFDIIETFRDGPDDMGAREDELDNIMHVELPIGSNVLMGSDVPSAFGAPVTRGNNVGISFNTTWRERSREQCDDLFGKLSEGGSISMPMQEMFWGSYFGACTDKFGVNWQINCEFPQD